ncbi:hypothetical protein CPB97_006781, partial [Podila verticillata]
MTAISCVSRDGPLELSFVQQRLWFLAQMEGVSKAYHMPLALRLQGILYRDALQRAMDTLFARHESLRSFFSLVNGKPQVLFLSAGLGLPCVWVDVRGASDQENQ